MSITGSGTDLVITGLTLPDYSARGMTFKFEPIDAAKSTKRDINGNLMDLSRPEFKKYTVTLTCTDQVPPDLTADILGTQITIAPIDGIPKSSLTMMVQDFSSEYDEWAATWTWELDLEEV